MEPSGVRCIHPYLWRQRLIQRRRHEPPTKVPKPGRYHLKQRVEHVLCKQRQLRSVRHQLRLQMVMLGGRRLYCSDRRHWDLRIDGHERRWTHLEQGVDGVCAKPRRCAEMPCTHTTYRVHSASCPEPTDGSARRSTPATPRVLTGFHLVRGGSASIKQTATTNGAKRSSMHTSLPMEAAPHSATWARARAVSSQTTSGARIVQAAAASLCTTPTAIANGHAWSSRHTLMQPAALGPSHRWTRLGDIYNLVLNVASPDHYELPEWVVTYKEHLHHALAGGSSGNSSFLVNNNFLCKQSCPIIISYVNEIRWRVAFSRPLGRQHVLRLSREATLFSSLGTQFHPQTLSYPPPVPGNWG